MEVSFQELKCKQVINTVDGKCLGHITDVIFDIVSAKTLGFVHPSSGKEMLFDSDIPSDMAAVLAKWDNYIKTRKEENI